MKIQKLLKPRNLAIIGASEKEGFGGDTCRNVMVHMAEDKYYFVNPKYQELFGKPCYPDISSLPEDIDLLVICTSVKTVEDFLREGAKKQAKAAIVYASGYGETGTEEGYENESSLKALCEELGIALMGPNCAGFCNFIDGITPFAFISNERDRKGKVGFVSQSGQLVLSMMDAPASKFSYTISAGNSSIVTMEDYLDFLVEDEDTKVIALYLEGIRNASEFVRVIKKATLIRKPVVILKPGKSAKAQAIAASHTGSMSGADRFFDALCKKFGVIRVEDLEELLATAQALATFHQLPKGDRFGSLSLSGGETGICADLGFTYDVNYPDFQPETMEKLKEVLPVYATPNNPLDSTATLSYDIDGFAKLLEIMMKDPGIDLVGIGYSLLQEIADNAIYYMSEAMKKVSTEPWAKPMVMIPFIEMTRNADYLEKLESIGIPVLPPAVYAFKIIKHILNFASYDPAKYDLNVVVSELDKAKGERKVFGELESKQLLSNYGIESGKYVLAQSAEEAVTFFRQLKEDNPEAKVVAKIESPDILHKTEAGGVILNLEDEEAVKEAYTKILENAKNYNPQAKILGVQVVEMAPSGVEMIIGVVNNPQLGPAILCGMGGVFVEVFKDTSFSLVPISREEAHDMVYDLKGSKLLKEFRGAKAKDVDALIDLLLKVSKLAEEQKNLDELDINPLFLYEKGLFVADALYIQRD